MFVPDPIAVKSHCRVTVNQFFIVLLIASLPLLFLQPALAVPALENECIVVAEVLERSSVDASALGIQPAQKLWRFRLRVVKVESVAGSENFLRGQEGKTIEVYSNEINAPAERAKRVTARIRFQGDERVGRYWIVGNVEG